MSVNRGKQFEDVIKKAFEKVEGVSIDRLHDQTTRYKGSTNICDFIVYKKPYQYYIECKSVHGNTLPFSNITDNQWNGMLEKSMIQGVKAGVICWWIDRDVTTYLPIQALKIIRDEIGDKSVSWSATLVVSDKGHKINLIELDGKKKKVFFDYDMNKFFEEVEK